MASTPKAFKNISLYRFKDNVDLPNIIEGPNWRPLESPQISDYQIETYATFNADRNIPRTIDDLPWLKMMNDNLPPDSEKFSYQGSNSYPCGALVLQLTKNGEAPIYFAAIFGVGGDGFIDKSQIIHDFGIICGMNMCDMDKLRRMQTDSPALKAMHIERQAGGGLTVHGFGIDFEKEVLKNIAGHLAPSYNTYAKSFKAADSITLNTTKDTQFTLDRILNACITLNEHYHSDSYKHTEFKVFDYFRPEKDKNIIERLDSTLCSKLKNGDCSDIFMAPPEFQYRIDLEYAYSNSPSANHYEDINIEDFLSYRRNLDDLSISILKSCKIYHIDSEKSGSSIPSWKAYNCLIAEDRITITGKIYVLQNGNWYLVDQALIDEITVYETKHGNYTIGTTCLTDLSLDNASEGTYNKVMTQNCPELYLFDRANIIIAGQTRPKYELCDLLSINRQLIQCKRYGNRASDVSHLFIQTKFYAKAFRNEEETRKAMRDYIDTNMRVENRDKNTEGFKNLIPENNGNLDERKWTILLCILHTNTLSLSVSNLPLMARHELMVTHKYLTNELKFKCSVTFKKITPSTV